VGSSAVVVIIPVTGTNNHVMLKITFLFHSDNQFGIQEIVLTRTTSLNALKQLPCDWLIK